MFSPQSYQMETFEPDNNSKNAIRMSDLSDNDDNNVNQESVDNIYRTEDFNINNSHSSNSESKITYFGIKGNSILSGVLNISASAIGAGCFTFPWIISSLGIFFSFFIFTIVTLCIYYSLDLLRHFVVDTKNFSFSLMTENTLGKKWLMVYSFSSFVYSQVSTP